MNSQSTIWRDSLAMALLRQHEGANIAVRSSG